MLFIDYNTSNGNIIQHEYEQSQVATPAKGFCHFDKIDWTSHEQSIMTLYRTDQNKCCSIYSHLPRYRKYHKNFKHSEEHLLI